VTIDQVSDLLRQTVSVTLLVSAPMLAAALVVGLVVSLVQAATQLNEQTLTFVPKIVVVLGLLALLFPWIMGQLIDFSKSLLDIAAQQGHP
jgi:flagellar biosynthetic protein FliQ